MRRVLLFAAFLLLLGLTTATAASFDVQAEDITSFSQPIEITIPDTGPTKLYLNADRSLSGTVGGGLTTEQFSVKTQEWAVAVPNGFSVAGRTVKLNIYTNGGDGGVLAELLECTDFTTASCNLVRSGSRSIPNVGSFKTVLLEEIPEPAPDDVAIRPGKVLRLRITQSGTWQLQYDKLDPSRESNLER